MSPANEQRSIFQTQFRKENGRGVEKWERRSKTGGVQTSGGANVSHDLNKREREGASKRLGRQQLAVRVHTCMRVFQFLNASPSVGLPSSPLSSPSEGRTRIPAQLPDSSPGRRSVRADK